jgi:antitoxin VapB
MAINIKNPEAERLAREVARRCGTGITAAVTDALREKLERERRKPRAEDDLEEFLRRVDEIVDRFNSRPLLDRRTPDEIIGYNEHGHFD